MLIINSITKHILVYLFTNKTPGNQNSITHAPLMHRPMHGPACPSTKIPIPSAPNTYVLGLHDTAAVVIAKIGWCMQVADYER